MFWGLITLMTVVALGAALRPLWRAPAKADTDAAADVTVFQDQLKAVEGDLARNVLSEEEAEGARIEISRRLLAAADRAEAQTTRDGPRRAGVIAAALTALALIAGTGGAYVIIGAPGAPDAPLAGRGTERAIAAALEDSGGRPDQATAEALAAQGRGDQPAPQIDPATEELITRLEQVLKTRPEDVQGMRLLARSLFATGQITRARKAFNDLLALQGENTGPDDLAGAAEAMITAVDGYVSPEAEALLARALRVDPSHNATRYFMGFARMQGNDVAGALSVWRSLLADAPPDAPWRADLQAQVDEIAANFAPGPDREAIDAAGAMTEAERAEMIDGMVAGLEARLSEDGGSPEEWTRLIRAYAVLNRPEALSSALSRAEAAYADQPDILALLRRAATGAGQ